VLLLWWAFGGLSTHKSSIQVAANGHHKYASFLLLLLLLQAAYGALLLGCAAAGCSAW
jgi:hypothetical protein